MTEKNPIALKRFSNLTDKKTKGLEDKKLTLFLKDDWKKFRAAQTVMGQHDAWDFLMPDFWGSQADLKKRAAKGLTSATPKAKRARP